MATLRPLHIISAAPRSHLFTKSLTLSRPTTTRTTPYLHHNFHTTPRRNQDTPSSPFGPYTGAAPPRLPKEEQEIFEALQRQSTGAFSTPRQPPQINQSPDSTATDRAEAASEITSRTEKVASSSSSDKEEFDRVIAARGKGEELHPNMRRGAKPEFEGDVNPKTGEVGGPKNEPLRWGAASEWTYNGRTTDF